MIIVRFLTHVKANGECNAAVTEATAREEAGTSERLKHNKAMEDQTDLVGRVFSVYRVEERLGKGGMGVVYRALDLQLGRPVALKFVSREADPEGSGHARLLREAQAAAALNHPNICTIYAVGEADGQLFIAMEYLEGFDVQGMVRKGALPWQEAISICLQAGRALEEAHSKHFVHRDVKSANIFVTRHGVTKLLDFGIAKFVADPDVTRTRLLVGTPSYMAPEQIEGGAADSRSDIWALGVVLYEMLTGKLPFGHEGKSPLRSILTDEPASLGTLLAGVPPELDQIIARALAKNPEDRYQKAAEMIADLERVNSGARTPIPHFTSTLTMGRIGEEAHAERYTVAVLPLLDLTPGPENEYICDGLAEELINGLTQLEGLRVVSRSSSFQCRGTTLDVREIGRKLRASHLVHGSLRRSGDRLRLTAQLTETQDGYQLWSHRFDADMKDLFSLQDELTEAILERLRVALGPRPAAALVKRAPANPEAYQLYLRARYLFNQQTGEGLRQALECLSRSIELDPEHAPAHIAVAECHSSLEWYGLESVGEAIPLVKTALGTGLQLEPNSAAGLCVLATVQAGYDWDWGTAERTFAAALAVGAGFAAVRFHYALDLLTPLGRLEEALVEIERALELDPLSAVTNTALGGCYYRMGRWSDAATSLRATLELNPGFGHAYWSLGRVLLEQGECDQALRHFDRAIGIMGRNPAALAELAYGLARVGRRDEAQAILNELETMSTRHFVSPVSTALIFAGLGDPASAMSRLELAFEQRVRQLVWINVDPRFDSLRNESAFRSLISRIGVPFGAGSSGMKANIRGNSA